MSLLFKKGYEVQFDDTRNISSYGLPLITSYKYHVGKYFKFYADFDYTSKIMSIYEGQTLSKEDCKFLYSALAIYGPIELDHNIGKKVIDFKVPKFKNICQDIKKSLKL